MTGTVDSHSRLDSVDYLLSVNMHIDEHDASVSVSPVMEESQLSSDFISSRHSQGNTTSMSMMRGLHLLSHDANFEGGISTTDAVLNMESPKVGALNNSTGVLTSFLSEMEPTEVTFEDFFRNNGAWRPPVPCTYCRDMRLQCFMLQTTSANPNPVTSCSSCVALYRQCSLAERGKREPLQFETRHPVIGHLHGVNEEGDLIALDDFRYSSTVETSGISTKRSSSRSVKRTRVLRNWFADHISDPYPSDQDKSSLAKQSGLSKTQVTNWFTNARRRQRQSTQALMKNSYFPQGSPMPQSALSNMSPLDRWRHSPPDEEPVSPSALAGLLNNTECFETFSSTVIDEHASSASGDSAIYPHSLVQYGSSDSVSSCYSSRSADKNGLFSKSQCNSEKSDDLWEPVLPADPQLSKNHAFQCTFCLHSFKKKFDWLRHERSVHLPGLDSWVCGIPLPAEQSLIVWRVDANNPECVFCGQESPSEDHFKSHEFEACAERAVHERTFVRKDHLWQHLYKFHSCRKWKGGNLNLKLLQHSQDTVRSRCGFCQESLDSWEERARHLTSHFRSGLTMAQWTGDCGIEDPGIWVV